MSVKRLSLVAVIMVCAFAGSQAFASGVGDTQPGIGSLTIDNGVGGGKPPGLDDGQEPIDLYVEKPLPVIDGDTGAGIVHTFGVTNSETLANWRANRAGAGVPAFANRESRIGQARRLNNGNRFGQTRTLPARNNRPR